MLSSSRHRNTKPPSLIRPKNTSHSRQISIITKRIIISFRKKRTKLPCSRAVFRAHKSTAHLPKTRPFPGGFSRRFSPFRREGRHIFLIMLMTFAAIEPNNERDQTVRGRTADGVTRTHSARVPNTKLRLSFADRVRKKTTMCPLPLIGITEII